MLKGLLVILGMTACVMAELRKIRIDHSQGRVLLQPPRNGPSDTTWELTTCKNCKMVLGCVLMDTSCKRVDIRIWDGKNTYQGCEQEKQVSMNSSINHEMTLQIKTSGTTLPAICQVTATKPYIGLPEHYEDSSEYGLEVSKAKCRCGWSNKHSNLRIVGGDETKVHEYPFAVLILLKARMSPFCGGSIISPYHILTAAHCTSPMKKLRLAVLVGEHDYSTKSDTSATKMIDVLKTIEHPEYDTMSKKNDIALLVLKTPIKFNDFIGPVCMPEGMPNMVDKSIKVMGWGAIHYKGESSTKLLEVNLKVIDPDICRVIYSANATSQFCTYSENKDSCQGDSGGPLVSVNKRNMYTQHGVVSYGRSCAGTDPGVNTNIAFYMNWIREAIASSPTPHRVCH